MTEHTKGPWAIAERKGQTCICGPATECLAALPYAPCEGYGLTDVFEVGANARLIAAAPDLLTALQNLVRQLLAYEKINNLCPNPGRKYCWDVTEEAIAAIENATGEKSVAATDCPTEA